jgi:putative flippase GtrA
LMKAGMDILFFHYIHSQFMAIAGVVIWNFFANKVWTFKNRE